MADPKLNTQHSTLKTSPSNLQSTILYPLSSELRAFLKDKLPEYMLPSAIVVMESLPLTPNGKLDRRALPAPDRASFEVAAYTPPRNDLEQQIADVWSQVLQIDRVGIHDSFFELGGHSLLIVRMHGLLRRQLGFDLSLTDVLQYPTIQALAQYLTGGADQQAEAAQRRIETRREARQGLAQRRQARGRREVDAGTAGDDE